MAETQCNTFSKSCHLKFQQKNEHVKGNIAILFPCQTYKEFGVKAKIRF